MTDDEFTPTEWEVREQYAAGSIHAEAEFDRMIAEVERAAAAQALEEAAGQLFLPAQGPAHYIDIGMAERMSADWLRARAAEIRERKNNALD